MDARTVLCSRHPAGFRILLAWSSGLLSFRLDRVLQQFLQKDNRREKKRRIHVYVFISFHESIVDYAQEYLQTPIVVIRIFPKWPMSIFNRNNQETSISLNVKSPITEMGIDDTYGSNVSKHFSALGSRSRRLELVSKILLLQPDGAQE